MISAALAFLAGASGAVSTAPSVHAVDTIRHLKGHHSLPVSRSASDGRRAAATCHPDPLKGRACRHHVAKAEDERKQALAVADRREGGLEGSAW